MSHEAEQARKQIDDLLNIPCQSWLLGAGVSNDAGVPLMLPLTDRVAAILQQDKKTPEPYETFQTIRDTLHENSHVEHIMSQIGDLLAMAERSKTKSVPVGKLKCDVAFLQTLHDSIQRAIRQTIQWGYRPKGGKAKEEVGTSDKPIVKVDYHCKFVDALFRGRRAGLERRPPVTLFTTNYDTLLEDALSIARVRAHDGFHGGAMAFWEPSTLVNIDPRPFSESYAALVYKLHGSIDWYASEEDLVVRLREGAPYPERRPGHLLIYPQATKYLVTQRDPFAALFAQFRATLSYREQSVLAICGYSFGDEHINEEIERALKQRGNRLTVLAFVSQPNGRLPTDQGLAPPLVRWLSPSDGNTEPWRERVIVAGRRGIYHGSMKNLCPVPEDAPHDWWSFTGVTQILINGTGAQL